MRLIESANNDNYSITTDLWTLRANQAILLHLKSHLLETKEFSNSLSAENVAKVLDQWQISVEKVVAATTNNCANMVPAVQLNDWMNVLCFSHTLSLAVESVAVGRVLLLAEVSKAIAYCHCFASHFHHSSSPAVSQRLNKKIYIIQLIALLVMLLQEGIQPSIWQNVNYNNNLCMLHFWH